jgi:hypothetical protein
MAEDPKVSLVIMALEQEKLRRVLERVQRGEAAFDGRLIFCGTESEAAADGLKPIRRENGVDIYPGPAPRLSEDGKAVEPPIRRIITGVPRGTGDDSPGTPFVHEGLPKPPDRYRDEARPTAPPPKPQALPEDQPPRSLQVQIATPLEVPPAGEIVQATFEVTGGLLIVTSTDGRELGRTVVSVGDDFVGIARRMVSRVRGGEFWTRRMN